MESYIDRCSKFYAPVIKPLMFTMISLYESRGGDITWSFKDAPNWHVRLIEAFVLGKEEQVRLTAALFEICLVYVHAIDDQKG